VVRGGEDAEEFAFGLGEGAGVTHRCQPRVRGRWGRW
jgi:hypothetical protein